MVANPFDRRAFTGEGEKSAVMVKRGEKALRLRFGALLHAAPHKRPPDAEYEYFRGVLEAPPQP